ncbi:MAG: hypothetical protein Q4G07_07400 [Oscillospiraceae bacterium]|nr:hypothetical protein [Oscillospiraceae bacterium]
MADIFYCGAARFPKRARRAGQKINLGTSAAAFFVLGYFLLRHNKKQLLSMASLSPLRGNRMNGRKIASAGLQLF